MVCLMAACGLLTAYTKNFWHNEIAEDWSEDE
jgi:hypothetical protein